MMRSKDGKRRWKRSWNEWKEFRAVQWSVPGAVLLVMVVDGIGNSEFLFMSLLFISTAARLLEKIRMNLCDHSFPHERAAIMMEYDLCSQRWAHGALKREGNS